MSKNKEALTILKAAIKDAQRKATITKQIIEREQEFLVKEEARIKALKLAASQLETAYD